MYELLPPLFLWGGALLVILSISIGASAPVLALTLLVSGLLSVVVSVFYLMGSS